MSVEKFKPMFGDGQIRHEPKPYTMILNKVLNECENMEAIGLWCHFQSKPTDWVINVQYVQNHFKVGRDKAYNLLRYLIKVNLMKQVQEKKPDGTFAGNYYIIKSGEEFLGNIKELSTPLPENPHPDNPHPENPTTTNKRFNTNTSKEKNKSFCDKIQKEKSKTVNNSTDGAVSTPPAKKKDWKEANQKKHSWADKAKEPPRADVTKQSTSYDPSKHETPKFDTDSPGYQAFVKSNPYLRRKHEKRKLEETSQTTELSTGTTVQPEVPSSKHSSKESSEHVLDGQSYLSPPVRSSNRVMAPSSARSYFEKVGLASEDRVNGDACY